MAAQHEQRRALPYDLIGQAAGVSALVERFYDLMDNDAAFAALRALHGPDLGPMRRSLTLFLMAWMGGPRDWFEQPNSCVMSVHARIPIGEDEVKQWLDCMKQSMNEIGIERGLAILLEEGFGRMAAAMRNR